MGYSGLQGAVLWSPDGMVHSLSALFAQGRARSAATGKQLVDLFVPFADCLQSSGDSMKANRQSIDVVHYRRGGRLIAGGKTLPNFISTPTWPEVGEMEVKFAGEFAQHIGLTMN
jgi:hypothetical protein